MALEVGMASDITVRPATATDHGALRAAIIDLQEYERALHDSDPVLQSWVSYSLTKSTCQLAIGGENPARATSFECELTGREHLLETWSEHRAPSGAGDPYLDELQAIRHAGLLREQPCVVPAHASGPNHSTAKFATIRVRHGSDHST